MQISAAFPPGLSTPDHIVRAEELGYVRAWCYDAPAVWGDVWMTLSRAADRTSRIGLGTAVVIPAYRHLLTNAAAIATLAAQAPGRVAVGLGPGRAQVMHGQKPGTWKDLEPYAVALKGLLRGEIVEWDGTPHKLIHPAGFGAARPLEVPILLAAEGPRGLEISRRLADGVISFGAAKPDWDWNAVLIHGCVDAPDDAYLLAAAGPGAGAAYHIAYLAGPEATDALPDGAHYRALIEKHDPADRAFAAWAAHLIDMTPEEAAVLTPARVRESTFSGTAAEVRSKLDALATAGATEVMYQPAGPDIDRELTVFAAMAGLSA